MKKIFSIILSLYLGFPCLAKEPPYKVSYKTTKIKKLFKKLKVENEDLYVLIFTSPWVLHIKELVITEVYRTKSGQKAIYGNNDKTSPHQLWDAVDIRTKNLTKKQIKELIVWFDLFNKLNVYKKTVIYHDVGLGKHLHIQFRNKDD